VPKTDDHFVDKDTNNFLNFQTFSPKIWSSPFFIPIFAAKKTRIRDDTIVGFFDTYKNRLPGGGFCGIVREILRDNYETSFSSAS